MHLEGVFLDGFDDVLEEDLRGEGVAVVDHRLVVRPVPAVQLHAAAALQQSAGTETHVQRPSSSSRSTPGGGLYRT